MTIDESSRERVRESFSVFAARVEEHHDDPQCNRRLYRDNIFCYQQNLKDWMTRLAEYELLNREDVYLQILETHFLLAEMLANPDRFSAPSREPTSRPVAPPDPQ